MRNPPPPPPPPVESPYREFDVVENGLTYTVRVTQEPDGSFSAKITVTEGAADFNALYFGDATDDGSSVGLKGNLNMNGRGDPDWDGAIKLSDPGLGKAGAAKPTYLEAGESYSFKLPGVDSFDDITTIGVRATSTSTPEGSIKSVAVQDGDGDDDDGGDDGNPDTYVHTPGGGGAVAASVTTQEAEGPEAEGPAPEPSPFDQMTGEDLFLALADAMGEVPENAAPDEAPEDEADTAPVF